MLLGTIPVEDARPGEMPVKDELQEGFPDSTEIPRLTPHNGWL